MVIWFASLRRFVGTIPLWVAQVAAESTDAIAAEDTGTMMQRLSPLNQIRVVTGLFTIVVLGLVIFLVIKAGAHMFRGLSAAARRLPTDSAPSRDDWANKPLNEAPEDVSVHESHDD